MDEKFRFQKQWETYRRRRNAQYIVGIIGLLVPNLIFFTLLKSGVENRLATIWQFFISMLAIIVIFGVSLHFRDWKCPNCGKKFFVRSYWKRFPEQLTNCASCNFPKFSGSTFEKLKK